MLCLPGGGAVKTVRNGAHPEVPGLPLASGDSWKAGASGSCLGNGKEGERGHVF